MKKRELAKLGFNNNIPSHPTITETIKRINTVELEKLLGNTVLSSVHDGFQQISIDGKSIRSKSKSGLLHLLSTYAPEIARVLSQTKSKAAGGEIVVAEKMVSNLEIKGKAITSDVMFVQTAPCSTITEVSWDYLLSLLLEF